MDPIQRIEQLEQLEQKKQYVEKIHRELQLEKLKGLDPDVLNTLRNYEEQRNHERDSNMIRAALQQAITETVQRIASVIINERREEIEAACNFGELREAIAAELARQFMAARFLNQPTPFDKPMAGAVPGGYTAQQGQGVGPISTALRNAAQVLKGTKTP